MNNGFREVVNLDTHEKLIFGYSTSAYQAMRSLIYYLNLKCKDPEAVIQKCGRCLTVIHHGETWTTLDK